MYHLHVLTECDIVAADDQLMSSFENVLVLVSILHVLSE